ncbi:uncharacterized protein SOCE26_068830 [Sorangium cellulosum]|uniref:Uncharacterized protein n=1 Tax=Sorangium cellulosum TaxID=56 RepID=A0A2L0F1D4_SORCE|nr:hypothetical protein [Sorangium cellulosum]AUX45392.1 uncharacterized protein SOCE26_068830 [Sorangium cellulosum]
MLCHSDSTQRISTLPKVEGPKASMGWEHLQGGKLLAHDPGGLGGVCLSRKLENPENSA